MRTAFDKRFAWVEGREAARWRAIGVVRPAMAANMERRFERGGVSVCLGGCYAIGDEVKCVCLATELELPRPCSARKVMVLSLKHGSAFDRQ